MKSFASDNNSPVHEAVMEAVIKANKGDYVSYGDDPYTKKAVAVMKDTFGPESEPFFVFTGTAANVLGISAVTRSYHSIITANTSHMNVDECGAPEKFTGCKLFTLDAPLGRLMPESVAEYLHGFGVEHHSQPRVISITQPAELGTVYTIPEIKELSGLAHRHGMLLHMDGARLFNAVVALDVDVKTITRSIDSLSFCLSKGLASPVGSLVCGSRDFITNARRTRKILGGGMRQCGIVAASGIVALDEMIERLSEDHANAHRLAEGISHIAGLTVQPDMVKTNIVYFSLDTTDINADDLIASIERRGIKFLYVGHSRFRMVTHYGIRTEDIDSTLSALSQAMA